MKWITQNLLNGKTYAILSKKIQSPLYFYLQIFLKLANDRPRLVKIKLKSGKVFFAYRFMDLFKLYEIFVEDDYAVELPHAENIVDVGGNKGYFSLRMSEQYPLAKFYCYEPEPSNFKSLQRLLNENGINADAYQEGVSGQSGELELFIHPKNDGGHSLFSGISGTTSVSVKIISLDTLMSRLPKGAKIDLMKLDCEGAERDIILNITPEYASRIKNIYYEATHSLYDPALLNKHLENLGYQITERHGIFKARKPVAV